MLLAFGEGCGWSTYCGTNPDQPDIQKWHAQRVEASTDAITDEAARGRIGWPSLVAWRDGEPVFQVSAGDETGCETAVLTDGGRHPLPLSVAGHGCAAYARDLLESGTLGGPALTPSPWQAQWWANALLAGLLGAIALVASWIVSRRRGSKRRPPGH